MSLMLKVMQYIPPNLSHDEAPFEDELEYTIYGDIVSCQFRYVPESDRRTHDAPYGEAHLVMREPIKTADVPGFVEESRCIMLGGEAFVMNDRGRTVSVFKPKRSQRPTGAMDNSTGRNRHGNVGYQPVGS